MDPIASVVSVKSNLLETPVLNVDTQGATLSIKDQKIILPDTALARWMLRAHFPKMRATPQGAEWYLQKDPLNLPQEIVSLMSNTPKSYQLMAVARMMIGNCALWLDMGLGKTFITLLYFLLKHKSQGCTKFLVVCPTTVFSAWLTEADTHLSNVQHKIVIAHGSTKNKLLRELHLNPPENLTIVITSYESLLSIAGRIKLLDVSGIVFDECSKIKNYAAKRTAAAHMVARESPAASVHLLSGTPSTKSVEGYYSLYELLGKGCSESRDFITFKKTYVDSVTIARCKVNPGGETVFVRVDKPSDYEKWMRSHCPPGETQTYWHLGYVLANRHYAAHVKHLRVLNAFYKPIGVKNVDQLHKITLKNAYCLKKEEVAQDLPPKSHVVRTVPLSEEIQKAYDDFKKDNRVLLEHTRFSFIGVGNPHMKLHQLANGFFYDQSGQPHWFASQPKITELLAILEEAGDQKIVIWSPFRPQITRVEKALTDAEIQYCTIHGDVSTLARVQLVTNFRKKPEIRCLVANPDVAGMGLTLIESHLAVVMTNWFKADVRAQLVDRLHRIGQLCPVTVVDLVSPGTLEPRILHCLKNNLEVEGRVLMGTKEKGVGNVHAGVG